MRDLYACGGAGWGEGAPAGDALPGWSKKVKSCRFLSVSATPCAEQHLKPAHCAGSLVVLMRKQAW